MARCVKGSGKTQLGGADRAEHAGLEKTALPLGVSRNQKRASHDHEHLGQGDYVPRFLSPNTPHLMVDARSISSRFPLRRKSGAHWLEIGPLLLT